MLCKRLARTVVGIPMGWRYSLLSLETKRRFIPRQGVAPL
nr:MAG TPA: hypothetical protein [Caudoviricetes sp.]